MWGSARAAHARRQHARTPRPHARPRHRNARAPPASAPPPSALPNPLLSIQCRGIPAAGPERPSAQPRGTGTARGWNQRRGGRGPRPFARTPIPEGKGGGAKGCKRPADSAPLYKENPDMNGQRREGERTEERRHRKQVGPARARCRGRAQKPQRTRTANRRRAHARARASRPTGDPPDRAYRPPPHQVTSKDASLRGDGERHASQVLAAPSQRPRAPPRRGGQGT